MKMKHFSSKFSLFLDLLTWSSSKQFFTANEGIEVKNVESIMKRTKPANSVKSQLRAKKTPMDSFDPMTR